MKSPLSLVLSLIATITLTPLAPAAELGDAAEPLQIAAWVKGKPVDLAAGKGKQVFVIEFWATWCGPCRESIPHLTELQKQFKDKGVVFIGITDEKTEVAKKFVEKMGAKMDYTVAVDAGKTSKGYMEAYGVNGIPNAFVVDKAGKDIP
jgi:thiol-disulfide isomerase/thioredoxin